MLILTRNLNQAIKIGDDIEIRIMKIKGKSICLGITAPKQVPVHREEIWEKIHMQQEAVIS
jgi:carbon storage regulator